MDRGDLYYVPGSFNLICDVCSKKIKASESKLRWDGLRVCFADYEERQPQDFVRARQDKISIPFSRPRPPDVFVDVCSAWGVNCLSDIGEADCCAVGFNNGLIPWTKFDK